MRSPLLAFLVLFVLLVWTGCSKDTKEPQRAVPRTTEPESDKATPDVVPLSPASTMDLVELAQGYDVAREEAVQEPRPPVEEAESLESQLVRTKERLYNDSRWAQSLSERLPALREEKETLLGRAEELELKVRVPSEPNLPEVEQSLREAVSSVSGVDWVSIEFQPQRSQRYPLPEEIEGAKELTLEENDIRDVIQVALVLNVPDRAVLDPLLEAIRKIPRLTVPRRISVHNEQVLVNAEVYVFPPLALPVWVVRSKDLRDELARSGVEIPLEEVVKQDPIGHVQSAAMALRHYNSVLEQVQEAVTLQGELSYLRVRDQFFRRKLELSKTGSADGLMSLQ